jgi:hypothetical protein
MATESRGQIGYTVGFKKLTSCYLAAKRMRYSFRIDAEGERWRVCDQPSNLPEQLAVGDLTVTAIVDAYTPLPLELMTRVPLQQLSGSMRGSRSLLWVGHRHSR